MDIYARKSNYKVFLLLLAVVIAIATSLYTNYITNKIADEEKRKAKLWAEAISKRAKLVKYTNDLFARLAADERKKVNIWAQSTKFIITVENNEELNFFSEIITSNNDIPVVLANETGEIVDFRNFEVNLPKDNLSINDSVFETFRAYSPIVISYLGKNSFIYYKDSNLFTELKNTLNEIISSFINEVVVNTASAPVLLLDEQQHLVAFGNIDSTEVNTAEKIQTTIKRMMAAHEPISIELGENKMQKIYFDDSATLKQLKLFPFVQLLIFATFLIIAYLAMSNARRAEQNQVWVGLAKETAHQLGTPISSLAAWVDYLREHKLQEVGEEVIGEIDHDVERLTLVADRFSKIGAHPQLVATSVFDTIEENVTYIKARSSKDVEFSINIEEKDLLFNINKQLFNWVLENLLKNALDAMNGAGKLSIDISASTSMVYVDVKDSGCGIPKGKFNTIFEPGFSTKRRGWGLGLSLTKRIVEEYHHGKIYVKASEINKGTTFRIEIARG